MNALTEAPEILALWGTGIGIVLLLCVSALFSGSETALTTASRGKLNAMADRGEPGAAVALRVTEDRERLIGALLLGNNIANILAASLATSLFTHALRRGRGGDRDAGDDDAGADLRRGAAQDLRHHQRRGLLGPGIAADQRHRAGLLAGGERGARLRAAGPAPVRRRRGPQGRTSSPRSRRSPAPSRCTTPRERSRRPTATGCSARSTSASARSRR